MSNLFQNTLTHLGGLNISTSSRDTAAVTFDAMQLLIGQFCHIAELNKTNKKLEKRIAELEKERGSLLRLISYVRSIVFSKVKCSYVSFKRPLEELLKDQGNG